MHVDLQFRCVFGKSAASAPMSARVISFNRSLHNSLTTFSTRSSQATKSDTKEGVILLRKKTPDR